MSRRDVTSPRASVGAVLPRRPAWWDRRTPAAPEKFTQEQQRERRRQRLTVHYTGTFDLTSEVSEIVCSLSREVSHLHRPEALRREIDAIVDAVGEVVHVAAGLLAESKTADERTRRLAADLAVRPRQPVITDEMLVSGSWGCVALPEYAKQVAVDLAAMLDRALPPDHEGLRGTPSASDRLVAALRILDRAAADLEHRIPAVRTKQGLPTMAEFNRTLQDQQDAERASAALARLGVTT